MWSRRESNPRPNRRPMRFLHAYSGIGLRKAAGTGHTYNLPTLLRFSSKHRSPCFAYLLFWLRGRRRPERSDPAVRRPYGALSYRLGSHGILSSAIRGSNIQIYVLIIQRTACLHAPCSVLSKPVGPGFEFKNQKSKFKKNLDALIFNGRMSCLKELVQRYADRKGTSR